MFVFFYIYCITTFFLDAWQALPCLFTSLPRRRLFRHYLDMHRVTCLFSPITLIVFIRRMRYCACFTLGDQNNNLWWSIPLGIFYSCICMSLQGDKNLIKFDGDHNSARPQFYYDSVSIFFYNVLNPPQFPSACSNKLEKYYNRGAGTNEVNFLFTSDLLLSVMGTLKPSQGNYLSINLTFSELTVWDHKWS